ncbi:MAG TPA: wax ester/triacylglycerol synthase domain-containing protein [Intrasporangium sp.]|nr:wax ester/triacylglycerol synthase domain-containing protein [Intrasporangium sp.]
MHIERTSPNDLTTLATDHGPVPMNIAAALLIDGGSDLGLPMVRRLLEQRLPRVPRLRQRILDTPLGHGRPVWVDDADFDLDRHLSEVRLDRTAGSADHQAAEAAEAADREQLLRVVSDVACQRLPTARPLWAARWVTGLSDGSAVLVLVVHHALADGLGGLAVLGALGDGPGNEADHTRGPAQPGGPVDAVGAWPPAPPFPQPPPPRRALLHDAWAERGRGLRSAGATLATMLQGLRELGLTTGPPRRAPVTSLNRPTGSRRELTTVTVPLEPVRDLAHASQSTVNDVLVTAIVGALSALLRRGDEDPDVLVVSVPISGRRTTTADRLGNVTGVVPLTLPTTPDPRERLARTAAISRARRSGHRASSAGPMGLAFRALGRLGLFQPFIDHQRLVNMFITNVRGPDQFLTLGGRRIVEIIPVAITPGNTAVTFDILSYAGRVCVTVVSDPDLVPDPSVLAGLLGEELHELVAGKGTPRPPGTL